MMITDDASTWRPAPELYALAGDEVHVWRASLRSGGSEVGVDVEHVRDDFAGLEIAERFFSPSEVQVLRVLPDGQRTRAFFNCWTRKEAYIKALGEGLSYPLDRFDVTLKPGEPAELRHVDGDQQEAARWALHHLPMGDEYAAALAVEGQSLRVDCWRWSKS